MSLEIDERRTRIAQHLERINEMMEELKKTSQQRVHQEMCELLEELETAKRQALTALGIWLAVAIVSGAALYWGLFY